MHFHLPKPLHGWREFAGEVAIIVLGVLIALAAEQAVENWHWRRQVSEARGSLAVQLAYAKYDSLDRLKISSCLAHRLDRLDDLITNSDHPKIVKVDLAPLRLWGTSAWDSAIASGAVAHMNANERTRYADLFTYIRVLGDLNRKEYDLVGAVELLNRPRTLSGGIRDQLIEHVALLRSYNDLLAVGAKQWLAKAEPLHLRVPDDFQAQLNEATPCPMPDDPAAAKQD